MSRESLFSQELAPLLPSQWRVNRNEDVFEPRRMPTRAHVEGALSAGAVE